MTAAAVFKVANYTFTEGFASLPVFVQILWFMEAERACTCTPMKNDFQKGIAHEAIATERHVAHRDLNSHKYVWKLFIETMLMLSYRENICSSECLLHLNVTMTAFIFFSLSFIYGWDVSLEIQNKHKSLACKSKPSFQSISTLMT